MDGVLTDVRSALKPLVAHLLHVVPEEWPGLLPPHTVARLCRSIGLSPVQTRVVEDCVREIPNFYAGLNLSEVARDYQDAIMEEMRRGNLILHAPRLRTRGDPLHEQTMAWLHRYGFNTKVSPIIWIKEL